MPSGARRGSLHMPMPGTGRCAIGVDVGTSAVKATLVTEGGAVLDAVSAPYETRHPEPGRSEQQPDDWWAAVRAVLAELVARGGATAGRTVVGVTGQMHTSVLRDAAGAVIRPAILWSDERARAEAAELAGAVPDWADIAGNAPIAAFTAAHLMWLARHERSSWDRITEVAMVKDDVRRRLAGGWAAEPSDASSTALLDVRTDAWSDVLLEAVGVQREWLADVRPSGEVVAQLRGGLPGAEALAGAQVIAGAGDQAAQAVALDLVAAGDVGISLGSSGAAFAVSTRPRPGAFRHALPERWLALDSSHAAGTALAWWSRVGKVSFAHMGRLRPTASAPVFLPYLQGHRAGPGVPAGLVNLRVEHGADDLAFAVVEGVALELAGLVRRIAGTDLPATIGLGGRAGQLPLLRLLLATALDRPVAYSSRGPAFGVARLAATADGWEEQFLAGTASGATPTEPDARLGALLRDREGLHADVEAALGRDEAQMPRGGHRPGLVKVRSRHRTKE